MTAATTPTTFCFSCGKDLSREEGSFVGRRDSCDHCRADIHVCFNCKHYDARAYNECREPQAERVVEKHRSNFCDFFVLVGKRAGKESDNKSDVLKKLDDLFK